jgi:hypothetical protein
MASADPAVSGAWWVTPPPYIQDTKIYCPFGLNFIVTEGGILRSLEISSLIIVGGPSIIKFWGGPQLVICNTDC